ncbi:hypothetical protein CR513_12173, partial [Mucuna pruriens]
MWGVPGSRLSVLYSGSRLKRDSLSTYLFILCMKKLALRIHELSTSSIWHPISISRGGSSFLVFLFVDDILLFCKAFMEQAYMSPIVYKIFAPLLA